MRGRILALLIAGTSPWLAPGALLAAEASSGPREAGTPPVTGTECDPWLEATPLASRAPAELHCLRPPGDTVHLKNWRRGPYILCAGARDRAVTCTQRFLTESRLQPPALEPGVAVEGSLLVDAVPAAGAQVAVVPAGLSTSRFFTLPLAREDEGDDLVRSVSADARGIFRLPPLAPGDYRLQVHLRGGRLYHGDPFRLPAAEAVRGPGGSREEGAPPVFHLGEIAIEGGVSVEVFVTDLAGAPLAGFDVGASQGEEVQEMVIFEAESDDRGRAVLSGIDPLQPVTLICTGEGYRRSRRSFEAPPPLHLCELEPLASLEGWVLTPSDDPLAGATVSIVAASRRAQSDREGGFTLDSLPAGAYELEVAASGYQPERLSLDLEPGEHKALPPIALLPGREWVARVVDATTGSPVAGARIRAVEPPGALTGRTDGEGELRVQTAGEGQMKLEVRARGYPRTLFPVDLAECANAQEPCIFELARGGRIRVLIWDEESGAPCVGCAVSVAGPGSGSLLTDDRGEALSEPLAPGLYQVTPERLESLGALVTRSGGHDTRWARVESGAVTEVRFGEPARGVEVVFSPPVPPGWSLEARSGGGRRLYAAQGDGSFQIQHRGRPLELFLVDGQGRSVRQAALPAELDTSSLRLSLPRIRLAGYLTTGDAPSPGRRLQVVSAGDGSLQASAVTGVDGAFSIPFLAPGSYLLLVEGRVVRTAAVAAGQEVELGRLEVTEGSR